MHSKTVTIIKDSHLVGIEKKFWDNIIQDLPSNIFEVSDDQFKVTSNPCIFLLAQDLDTEFSGKILDFRKIHKDYGGLSEAGDLPHEFLKELPERLIIKNAFEAFVLGKSNPLNPEKTTLPFLIEMIIKKLRDKRCQ